MRVSKLTGKDESITFVIAGLMIDLERYTTERKLLEAARVLAKYRKVIEISPGFLERFKDEQESVLAEFNRLTKLAGMPDA